MPQNNAAIISLKYYKLIFFLYVSFLVHFFVLEATACSYLTHPSRVFHMEREQHYHLKELKRIFVWKKTSVTLTKSCSVGFS